MSPLSPAGRRRKGAVAERELARLLLEHLGVRVERNLNQFREGGCDLIGLAEVALEVKRHADARSADIREWWAQTAMQAELVFMLPALAFRLDRQDWRFLVPISLFFESMPFDPGFEWTAEISLDAFCLVMRERLLNQ